MQYPGERLSDGYEEIATHEFRHIETDSTISFVGLHHHAPAEFYQAVNEYVLAREEQGSVIHYERTELPNPDELAQYPMWVQKLAPRMDSVLREVHGDASDGKVNQFNCEEITFAEPWENHDLNRADIIRELGYVKAKLVVGILERLAADDYGRKPVSDLSYDLQLKAMDWMINPIIVDQRDAKAVGALEAVIHENPDQDVTLLWGSAHLPGISRGIVANDYVHHDTIWMRAGRANS